jgi:hypothetical protein
MRRLALLALVVLGFGVAGYAVFLWPTPTGTTYYLDASPVSEAALGDGPVVAYEGLSADNRRLFDRALGNETATVGSDTAPLNARYVRYDGTYYETSVRPVDPDDGAGLARLGMFAIGGLGTLLATFGLVGLLAVSWERERASVEDSADGTDEFRHG